MIAGKAVLKTLCLFNTQWQLPQIIHLFSHRPGDSTCFQIWNSQLRPINNNFMCNSAAGHSRGRGFGSSKFSFRTRGTFRPEKGREREEGRRKKHTSVDIKIVEPWILLFFSHCGVLLPRVRVQHLGLLFYETFPTDLSVLFVNSRTFSAWIHKTWKRERCMWSRALRLTQLCLFDIHLKSISVDDYGQHYLFFLGWDVAFGQQMFGCDLHSCFLPIYQQMCRCSEI